MKKIFTLQDRNVIRRERERERCNLFRALSRLVCRASRRKRWSGACEIDLSIRFRVDRSVWWRLLDHFLSWSRRPCERVQWNHGAPLKGHEGSCLSIHPSSLPPSWPQIEILSLSTDRGGRRVENELVYPSRFRYLASHESTSRGWTVIAFDSVYTFTLCFQG